MILIVDDQLDSSEPLQRLLMRSGLETRCASSAAEALAVMRKSKPKLVILDEMMPEMSGMEMLKVLQSDPQLFDVPVLFLSALSDPNLKEEALRCGAAGWFVKEREGWEQLLVKVLNTKVKE